MRMDWRKALSWARGLPAYAAGMDLAQAARSVGRRPEEVHPLNSNENLFIDRAFIGELVRNAAEDYDPRMYPKGEVLELVEMIAKSLGVKPEMVFIGFGSDQLIDLLIQILCHVGIGFVEPTFPMYSIRANSHRARIVRFSFDETFALPVDRILSEKEKMGLFFFCSPNNPTGHAQTEEEVKALLEGFEGLVVSDEAYSEISGRSFLHLLDRYDNLVILRTFSKAYGMAGLRLGYIIANEELIDLIKRVQFPFPASGFSVRLAMKALELRDKFIPCWKEARRVRDWALKKFEENGIKSTPTKAIFSVISTEIEQDRLFIELLKAGYLTRKLKPFLSYRNPLRVTFGPMPIMEGFLDSLLEIINRG